MDKILLLVTFLVLTVSNVAMADHIGVYSDATGSSCILALGFTSTTAVVHKYSVGATGSRFKLTFPPGSSFFAFTSSFPVVLVVPPSDFGVPYGSCLTGSF